MKEKCPCKGCLVIALCRQKYFDDFKFCKEISEFLGCEWMGEPKADPENSKKHLKNYPKFYRTLKPTKWTFRKWPRGHERHNIDYIITHKKKPKH